MANKYHNPIVNFTINGFDFTAYAKSVDVSYGNPFMGLDKMEVVIRLEMPISKWQEANEPRELPQLDDGSILLGPGDVDVK